MSESLCRLARQSIESYIKKGVKLRPDVRLGLKAGCFISLHQIERSVLRRTKEGVPAAMVGRCRTDVVIMVLTLVGGGVCYGCFFEQ